MHESTSNIREKLNSITLTKVSVLLAAAEGDVFFHISDFPGQIGEPKRNERVKFNVVENGDKYKAIKIERVEDNSKKAKKTKVATHNKSITSALLKTSVVNG